MAQHLIDKMTTPLTAVGTFTLSAIPASYITVRDQPSVSGNEVGRLHVGDAATLWQPEALGWVYLTTPTLEGWVSRQGGYVRFTPLAGDMPAWTVKLDVPYVAQISPTANRYRNDCGCACAIMCLRWLYVHEGLLDPTLLTVDELAAKTGLSLHDDGLSSEQLVTLLKGYGAASQKVVLLTASMVRQMLKAGTPVVCLLNYGWFNPNNNFKGGHFAVAIGYDDHGVYFNDPYLGGAHFHVTDAALDQALSNVTAFASPPNQGVILSR